MTAKSEGMRIPGKLKWYAILALALWLAFSGVAAAEQLYVNESSWWRDGGAFNVSETPIQAAVDAAGEGDAIYVHGGNYNENVNVDKPRLTLEGEGANAVTVTAASAEDHVFEVTADYVTISGFTVTWWFMPGMGVGRSGMPTRDRTARTPSRTVQVSMMTLKEREKLRSTHSRPSRFHAPRPRRSHLRPPPQTPQSHFRSHPVAVRSTRAGT